MRIVRITIHGRVQGVGFRAFVEDEAARCGVEGWVRNRRDGSVEALFAGDAQVVDEMIRACRRGPSVAHTDRIDVHQADATELAQRGPGERFSVLRTV